MKPPKTPGYVEKRQYTLWHQIPGGVACPECGLFGHATSSPTNGDHKTQYRICVNGHRFKTSVRVIDETTD